MKIEKFLKSLQGVTADDLDPDERSLLKSVLGDDEPEIEDEPVSADGLLAKALGTIDNLAKAMMGGKGKAPAEKDDDEGDEEEDEDAKDEAEEDEEDEDRLEEAVKDLAGQLDHEEKEEKVKKSMGYHEDADVTVEDLAKSLLDQYRAVHADEGASVLEAVTDLAKSVKAQAAEIETLKKSLAEQGGRPVPTLAPFELRKSIDTKAGELGLPGRDDAVSSMQKAFAACTNDPDLVPMNKSITATDVQAVENAYSTMAPEALEAIKPLLARAKDIAPE